MQKHNVKIKKLPISKNFLSHNSILFTIFYLLFTMTNSVIYITNFGLSSQAKNEIFCRAVAPFDLGSWPKVAPADWLS